MASVKELKQKRGALEAQITDLDGQIKAKEGEIASLVAQARNSIIPRAREELRQRAEAAQQQLGALLDQQVAHAAWDAPLWATWQPDPEQNATLLRIGELRGDALGARVRVPVHAPFVGSGRTLLVPDATYDGPGLALVHGLLQRAAVLLPHKVQFVLLDPAHHGLSFPMSAYYPVLYDAAVEMRQSLQEVERLLSRRARDLSAAKVDSFEKMDPELFYEDKFVVLCAADFPNNYDRRAIETLQNIARSGPKAGVYLVIHVNSSLEMPRDLDITAFEGAFAVGVSSTFTDLNLALAPDTAGPVATQEMIWKTLVNTMPPDPFVDPNDVLPDEPDWWRETSTGCIAAPFGRARTRGQALRLWFGQQEGAVCSHAILAGWSGSGKSVSLHAIIAALATRYSPQELRLYLVDGKNGTEFQAYRELPHAEVVSLRTSAEMARSVLAELVAEMERRNSAFVDVGAQNIESYRAKGHRMPRILMVVDEYQLFFEGDRAGEASNLMLQLSQQGRAAGVHMLMGSQSFNTTGMDHSREILGNMHLRVSLKLSQDDANNLTAFGREGRELIQRIASPGQLVANASGGQDGGNVSGKAAFIDQAYAANLSAAMATKAARDLGWDRIPALFDGARQPNLGKNAQLTALATLPKWPSPAERESLARRPVSAGGFGVPGWYASDRPYLAVLGKTFSVHEQAQLVIERGVNQHLVLVGDDAPTVGGMMSGLLASLALNAPTTETELYVIQGQDEAGDYGSMIEQLARPAGIKVMHTTDGDRIGDVLDRLVAEVGRRAGLASKEVRALPSAFLLIVEGDRIAELRLKPGRFGDAEPSELGIKLGTLLSDGSAQGIHVCLVLAGMYGLRNIVDLRHSLPQFRHRVCLQMTEDDSHALLRSPIASRLQVEGQRPVVAVYRDMAMESTVRFRPFTTDDNFVEEGPGWAESLTAFGSTLQQRRWAS